MTTTPLSGQFAHFIAEQSALPHDSVLVRSAAWLVDAHAQGDVCLNLNHLAEQSWPETSSDQQATTPPLKAWRAELLATHCVGTPGAHAPLILDGDRLYLHRLWQDETEVAAQIHARINTAIPVDEKQLQQGLARLFPTTNTPSNAHETNWQKVAAALAVCHCFAVIAGGPGTGKTRSLVSVLALLLEQSPQMRIRLAAPTGKAAARMMEAIRNAKATLATSATHCALIPEQASTLHRLLGYTPRGWRHNARCPLPLDCLVVDEASMIDLPMMARLLRALPPTARLILLGDRDQLASVDAGSVLGDITGHGHPITYSTATLAQLSALSGETITQEKHHTAPAIANTIALLKKSYRFQSDSAIAQLALQVNNGAVKGCMACVNNATDSGLTWWQNLPYRTLIGHAVTHYTPYLNQHSVAEALTAFEQFRVLCALREGEHGILAINRAIGAALLHHGVTTEGHLTPILITANHYDLNLFNGDTGLLWRDSDGLLRAYFRQEDNLLRAIPAALLPAYQPAWAMTVHKSQGSEFARVMLLLPEHGGEVVVTRELLYTAITRARSHFMLAGSADTIAQAVTHTVTRSTGLADRLHWGAH
ncbi:MAG: exodeoxyribonuclease V subunit alpha [Mariprofundales bacterium]